MVNEYSNIAALSKCLSEILNDHALDSLGSADRNGAFTSKAKKAAYEDMETLSQSLKTYLDELSASLYQVVASKMSVIDTALETIINTFFIPGFDLNDDSCKKMVKSLREQLTDVFNGCYPYRSSTDPLCGFCFDENTRCYYGSDNCPAKKYTFVRGFAPKNNSKKERALALLHCIKCDDGYIEDSKAEFCLQIIESWCKRYTTGAPAQKEH